MTFLQRFCVKVASFHLKCAGQPRQNSYETIVLGYYAPASRKCESLGAGAKINNTRTIYLKQAPASQSRFDMRGSRKMGVFMKRFGGVAAAGMLAGILTAGQALADPHPKYTFYDPVSPLFGNVSVGVTFGDFDAGASEADTETYWGGGKLGWYLDPHWALQGGIDYYTNHVDFGANANDFTSYNASLGLHYRLPTRYSLGLNFNYGETKEGSNFDGEYTALDFQGALFLENITLFGQAGVVDGKNDYRNSSALYGELGARVYLDFPMPFSSALPNLSIGARLGLADIEDTSDDAFDARLYGEFKSKSDMPVKYTLLYHYSELGDTDSHAITIRTTLAFGASTWVNKSLRELDRTSTFYTFSDSMLRARYLID